MDKLISNEAHKNCKLRLNLTIFFCKKWLKKKQIWQSSVKSHKARLFNNSSIPVTRNTSSHSYWAVLTSLRWVSYHEPNQKPKRWRNRLTLKLYHLLITFGGKIPSKLSWHSVKIFKSGNGTLCFTVKCIIVNFRNRKFQKESET